jgi:excinuclease ABC subunit C
MNTSHFRDIQHSIPKEPGVYKFIDDNDGILYVGKAKNLRNRLSSYFGERADRAHRTRVMVKNAARIEFTIVESEADALLLENSLIKRYQPRYNVRLKDDKSYTYICIKNERFPRILITRRVIRDGSAYFGPYTSSHRLKIILDLIKQLFPLRTCALNLSQENIAAGKFKVCLEYHIKNCLGPCEGLQEESAYNEKITQIKNMLKGNFSAVINHFKADMLTYAENLEFEKAQQIKEKLDAFEDYQGKSTVVSSTIRDVDVFAIAADEKNAYVNYLKVINGAIIHTHTLEMEKNLNQEPDELLAFVIPELRERFQSIAPEIIVPCPVALPDQSAQLTIPKIGDKRKLLDLSEKNVRFHLLQKQKEAVSRSQKTSPAERILRTLQQDLHMKVLPTHIECFDNSNIQGSNPASACVVFKNAKPAKKDYRHFKIKTVEGPNDFASMEEVVYRRYKRLLDEQQPLPQLIVIDGGKGQLSAAMKSINELGIANQVTVIGIAKKLEEIFFPNDSTPLLINKKSESLKLIQQARNEAHRFSLAYHRNRRSKAFLQTELTTIPGIGEKTAEKLLRHFGSVTKVRNASSDQLIEAIGKSAATKINAYFTESNPAPPTQSAS